MSRSLKEEFRPEKFGLGYPDPDVFVKSQWRLPKWTYFLWRLFWFLWHMAWIIASGVNTRLNKARYPEEGVKWFIYLTNTTLLLTTLTCTVDFAIVLYVIIAGNGSVLELSNTAQPVNPNTVSSSGGAREKEEIVFRGEFTVEDGLKEHTTTWYLKLVWFLYNVICSTNILVTILYWAVEYDGKVDAVGVVSHVINTVFILSNLMVSAMPVQILHLIYPVAYAALYVLFTFIYYEAGGTDIKGRDVIYSFVDWGKAHPTAATVILSVLVATPLAHLVVFAVYTFRVFLHSRLNSASYTPTISPREISGARSSASASNSFGTQEAGDGNSIEMATTVTSSC